MVFYIFLRKWGLIFHLNRLPIHVKCQVLFSQQNFRMSAAIVTDTLKMFIGFKVVDNALFSESYPLFLFKIKRFVLK